jgi:hypothetical protein
MDLNIKDKSVTLLIIVNLLPLVGVFVFGWDAIMIVLFYCIETFIIGIVNIFKMIRSKAEIPKEYLQNTTAQSLFNTNMSTNHGCIKATMVPFFIVHFNGFVIIQTVMIVVLSNQFSKQQFEIINLYSFDFLINLLLLLFSHIYSYRKNYIGKGEYKIKAITTLMFAPYKRVIVQQLTVLLGTFFIIIFNGPTGFLILLILLKIYFDIRAHNKSHTIDRNINEISF